MDNMFISKKKLFSIFKSERIELFETDYFFSTNQGGTR